MKNFCLDLKEQATKIINPEKKRNDTINKRRKENTSRAKGFYVKKDLVLMMTIKHTGTAHDICNLRYTTPKGIPAVFYNGSIYDYHFIIKELAEEFKEQFERLGENTEKYIAFSVPIKKELDNGKSITYKI